MPTEIPQPPGWPLIGNILELGEADSIPKLLAQYGPIVKYSHGTGKAARISIGSAELVNELCDESRFVKMATAGALLEVRNGTGDGLFTARNGEENWGLAHRILAPVLGPMMIGTMFEDMHEVASQLVLKWARLDQDASIHVTDDFTRLTLDTLALCAMDTRFNSFYSERPHPFVEAMSTFLKQCGMRMLRPSLVTDYMFRAQTRKFNEDIEVMRHVANTVLERRKSASVRKRDLVDAMLYEKDPKTGKSLPHDNIINNMITFLIAGHETTSGLLSFVIYCLVTHSDAMQKAREEVLSVLGHGAMRADMVGKLPYLSAVIRETLRLYPTAPSFTLMPKSQDPADFPIYLGKEEYVIRQGESISVSVPTLHREAAVYGEDAEEFRPERMLDEAFNKLPKSSFKPFGNGARGCIGRAFALQESTIVIALLLQNFDFSLADPTYQLSIRKTLTIKPKNFFVRAKLRDGLTLPALQQRLVDGKPNARTKTPPSGVPTRVDSPLSTSSLDLTDLLIAYGSNTGTCQTLAHLLSRSASSYGFRATTISMDAVQPSQITPSTAIVIITASYEGQPPDNAATFMKWLQGLTESPFAGVCHAVYGCGNREWASTFQRIPMLVDDAFRRCGSTPLVERGVSDAADGDIVNEFDRWADGLLWPALLKQYHPELLATQSQHGIEREKAEEVKVTPGSRAAELLPDSVVAVVEDERILTAEGEPQKRHLKLRLPPGTTYAAGDHVVILPSNHDGMVKQAMNRFGISSDAEIITKNGSKEYSVYMYLRDFVELNEPATEKNIRAILATLPPNDNANANENTLPTPAELKTLNLTALQLLQSLPTATLTFPSYLAMLPPLHTRRYSISSSPLTNAATCTLTYSVLSHPVHLGAGTPSTLHGAGSTYLASLTRNDRLRIQIRPSPRAFHLPEDPTVPVVMVCAGAGLAPFVGFVEERAALARAGVTVAPALLFVGCRGPERDMLYGAALGEAAAAAGVAVRYAFSRGAGRSEGCKYVQERVWRERGRVLAALGVDGGDGGCGKMFVCGETRVLEGVARAVKEAYAEVWGVEVEAVEEWWAGFRADGERFACEVFD